MSLIRILLWLGYSIVVCAVLQAVAALAGLLSLEFREAALMATLAVSSGAAGMMFILISYNAEVDDGSDEAIAFLILFWIILSVLGSLPFYVLGGTPSIITAVFEGVSAFTTTGASTLTPEGLPSTLLFWRSLLQFFGGVCSATFAIVILAALNLSGSGIHRSVLFTFQTGALLTRLWRIGRLVGTIYLFLVLVAFVLLTFGGTEPFDAICLGLSAVSTGGLQTQSGPLATFLSPASAIILAILCLLGAFNISIVWDLLRQRRMRDVMRLLGHVEHRALLGLIAGLILTTVIFASLYNLGPAILDAIFFVSTAGYRYDVISLDMVPAPILIMLALLGGAALSTAGGIKIIRILLLFRHLGTDLARLSHPSRIVPIQFRGLVIEDKAFLSVWMYFFGYTFCFALGGLTLAASGLSLPDALSTSAASLANIGPLLEMTLPASGLQYSQFTPVQMILSSILMILGRVEVLLALSLFMPVTWRG